MEADVNAATLHRFRMVFTAINKDVHRATIRFGFLYDINYEQLRKELTRLSTQLTSTTQSCTSADAGILDIPHAENQLLTVLNFSDSLGEGYWDNIWKFVRFNNSKAGNFLILLETLAWLNNIVELQLPPEVVLEDVLTFKEISEEVEDALDEEDVNDLIRMTQEAYKTELNKIKNLAKGVRKMLIALVKPLIETLGQDFTRELRAIKVDDPDNDAITAIVDQPGFLSRLGFSSESVREIRDARIC